MPGSALGTPAYMSPEQAVGDLDRLGPRSDVYSLGATLYCLLTGKPPFEGEDVGEVLRKVQRGEFVPPRQRESSLDAALEAVCLKAMANQPGDRYPSCRALADDVERWMADEPVSAWAEPWTRKLLRWLTRHRTGVTGAAAAVLAGVVGLSAVLAVQARANLALADTNTALLAANAKIEARYNLAVEAIKTFHTGVSEDFLLKEERFKELRDRLLKAAADFYGRLGALLDKETDIASRRALAQSNFELAELTGKVGRNEDALAAHRAVLAAREAMAAEPGAGAVAKVNVVRSLIAVASLLAATGKTDEALASYRRSESLLAGAAGADPSARAMLAAGRSKMGWLLGVTGKSADALVAYRLARADQEALAAAPAASNDARHDLADTINRIGALLFGTGKPAEAEAELRNALAIRQKLADDNPAVTEFRSGLAYSHNNLGYMLKAMGKPVAAAAEYRKALALEQKLADDNPAVTEFRFGLASSTSTTARCCRTRASRRRRRPSSARRWRSTRSWPTTTPPSPTSATTWRGVTACSPTCCRRRASRRRRRPSPARRWRSGRSWPTTTPPTPDSAAAWRTSTSTTAACCRTRASQRRRRPSSARRWRSGRSWLTTTPPTPARAVTGGQTLRPRHPAVEHGQAGGGGGRVPRGAGDPAEAGQRQPRRHRLPRWPGLGLSEGRCPPGVVWPGQRAFLHL